MPRYTTMAASKMPLIVAAVVIIAVATVTFVARRDAPGSEAQDAGVTAEVPTSAHQASAPPASRAPPRVGAGPMTPGQVQASLDRRATMRDAHVARTTKAREEATARFEQESVDPAWAPQKEAELTSFTQQEAFATAGVSPRSLAIDCKSSMCRVDGSFASNGDAEDWILIYMSSVGSSLPSSLVSRRANPDGTTGVQIYGRGR